jgi:small subunit ribosomal protein S6
LREYETTIIVQPEISEEGTAAFFEKLDGILDKHECVRLLNENLGKRKLAYEIRKFHKGHYYILNYLSDGKVVPELEWVLRLDESILRFMTIQVTEQVLDVEARKAEAREKELEQERKAAERATREAEEAAARAEVEKAAAVEAAAAAEVAKAAKVAEAAEVAEASAATDSSDAVAEPSEPEAEAAAETETNTETKTEAPEASASDAAVEGEEKS